jgi:hypothetical protein
MLWRNRGYDIINREPNSNLSLYSYWNHNAQNLIVTCILELSDHVEHSVATAVVWLLLALLTAAPAVLLAANPML